MDIVRPSDTPIVFFGTGDFSLTSLVGLVESSYNIAAVITKPDSKSGRGQKVIAPAVKTFAQRNNITVWQPEKVSHLTEDIRLLQEPIGVLASYGHIIPQSVIDLFHPGIINIHPSLLPKYRGSSPIESAILNGDSKTGVSVMQLSARMDAGPVYKVKEYMLNGSETKPELYRHLAQYGADLLLETLPSIMNGTLLPIPQNETDATYTARLSKADGIIDPSVLTAVEAERRVRAYLEFPKSRLAVGDFTIIPIKAHVSPTKESKLDVLCRDGKYLSIETLIAPSGRHMNAADFERGYLTRQE